ncbi:hypothetical protein [Moorena sp. SIO3H5]|uniref:hypothetical protein n=1 Tax=Moorena sp. SIO3H5 TaxID=2607834 RepID=UPI0013BD0E55|nr:hypothetical protein [Moorena sp. SIO3H5]NEO72226.1 hypothetical protein [Moorena sp. SIO3H5]
MYLQGKRQEARGKSNPPLTPPRRGRQEGKEIRGCIFPTPDSRLPTPDSRFPIPYSLLPTPYSLFPER